MVNSRLNFWLEFSLDFSWDADQIQSSKHTSRLEVGPAHRFNVGCNQADKQPTFCFERASVSSRVAPVGGAHL
jgi:hypothetical protein